MAGRPGTSARAAAGTPETTATDAPMFTSLAARRSGPSWRPYALLVLAGLVGGALGLAFTSPGKALLARLTSSKGGTPQAQAQAATGPSPTAVMDQHPTAGATGTPAAHPEAPMPPVAHVPAPAHPPQRAHPPQTAPAHPVEVAHHPATHPPRGHPHKTHVADRHPTRVADHTPPPPTHVVDHTPPPPPDHGADHHGTEVASLTPTPAQGGRCPKGMVYVPAGPLEMGSAINDPMRNFAEKTLHKVSVKAYCIDRYEYGGHGHRPLTSVSWYRANSLCERQGKHLCSEAEWEKAWKGPRNDRFPYGNVFKPNACNTEDAQGNDRHVEDGGSLPKCRSGYRVVDMSGNVSEWTASKFQRGPSPPHPEGRGALMGPIGTPAAPPGATARRDSHQEPVPRVPLLRQPQVGATAGASAAAGCAVAGAGPRGRGRCPPRGARASRPGRAPRRSPLRRGHPGPCRRGTTWRPAGWCRRCAPS